jgi:hypothetical protein
MSASLAVVTDHAGRTDNISDRIRRLQAEAKGLAREHVEALEAALAQVERLSAEIADGGDVYPPGVRDIARRLVDDCELKIQTLEAIVSRS